MKIPLLADTHIGARNDSEVFNQHFLKFYEEVFFPYIEKHGFKTIIHLGDVFDRRKYINFKTFCLWQERFFDRLEKDGIVLYIIIGNHDTYLKNTNEINSIRALLRNYSNIRYYESPEIVNMPDGSDVLFAPWLANAEQEDDFLKFIKRCKKERVTLCMGHFEILGFMRFQNAPNYDKGLSPEVLESFKIVLSGHFHTRSKKGNIEYLGSPYQITWSDYGDIRGFHVIDTDTHEMEFIRNPDQMFYRIDYDDSENPKELLNSDFSELEQKYVKVIVKNREKPVIFDKYLALLHEANVANVSVIDSTIDTLTEEVEVDETKDTLTIMTDYVNELEMDHSKEVIKVLSDLYNRAMEAGA